MLATIGAPTSSRNFQTGKAWIPFHYSGHDNMRIADHFKGQGVITYSLSSAYNQRFNVIRIEYDSGEQGF